MQRVDVNALLERVDMNALLDRVDVDQLMARVDVDALMDRIDVEELVRRSGIPDVVKESTSALAGSALDVIRRQLVALDSIVGRPFYRLTGRDPAERPVAPDGIDVEDESDGSGRGQVTGFYAGPVTRLWGFVADALVIWLVFALVGMGIAFVVQLFTSIESSGSVQLGLIGLIGLVVWAFVYFWFSLAVAGRTFGMGVVGLGVVTRQGGPISGRAAFVRTLVFPFSFVLLGLGLLGILLGKERRALHDVAAGTVVVYDWGDRPAEMPAPLTRWLERHDDSAAP
jgi:uncharacterized RDD family membrane protein YckC